MIMLILQPSTSSASAPTIRGVLACARSTIAVLVTTSLVLLPETGWASREGEASADDSCPASVVRERGGSRPTPPPPPPPVKRRADLPPPAPPMPRDAGSVPRLTASEGAADARPLAPALEAVVSVHRQHSAPRRRRVAALIGASAAAYAGSLGLGVLALRLNDRRCFRLAEAAGGGVETDAGRVVIQALDRCIAADSQILAVGVTAGVTYAAGVSLATVGGWQLRPDPDSEPGRGARGVRLVLGSVLLSLGLTATVGSRLAVKLDESCLTAFCLREKRTGDLVLRSLGGLAASSGGALLGSVGRRSGERRYARLVPKIDASPGLALVGSF